MIPPLNVNIKGRGAAPAVISGGAQQQQQQQHRNSPPAPRLQYEFGVEPGSEATMSEAAFVEGAMPSTQAVDCVRQMYLGKSPYSVKACTRCHSLTLHQFKYKVDKSSSSSSSSPAAVAKAWEQRWVRSCHCGGNWKIRHFI